MEEDSASTPKPVDPNAPPRGRIGSSAYRSDHDVMLRYFCSAVDVRLLDLLARARVAPTGASPPPGTDAAASPTESFAEKTASEIRTTIESFRKSPEKYPSEDAAWTDAYRAERLLALLEPPETLLDELRRRVDQAAAERVVTEPRLRAALIAAEKQSTSTQAGASLPKPLEYSIRSSLLGTLEDIHWTLQRKFYARPLKKRATTKIVFACLTSFLLSIAPYIVLFINIYMLDKISLRSWAWLPLYTAITAGLFGAFFSRLIYLQQNWESLSLGELKNSLDVWAILLRGSVGMCGSIVVFFFLQSGLIQGSLFPNIQDAGFSSYIIPFRKESLNEIEVVGLMVPRPALALLFVWSFIAGFSERLVPTILSSTERNLADSVSRPAK